MGKLNVSKGKGIARHIDSNRSVVLVDHGSSTQSVCHMYEMKRKEHVGNAELFADSLTTHQACELLPSELLDLYKAATEATLKKAEVVADLKGQVQQLREALVKLVKYYDSPSHIDRNSAYLLAKQALKATEP